jgi:GMP synthase (glutamine-hydrolysing)
MPTLLAVRHVAYEDLDGLDEPFRRRGFDISYVDAWHDPFPVDSLKADVVVVLGAPVGVYESADFPFIQGEIDLVRQRIAAGRPVLGICFGAQIMAAAMGAQIARGPSFEFGWAPLRLTEAGLVSPLRHYVGPELAAFHCHGDTFEAPDGATPLASTEAYSMQGFKYGPHLAMQFHGEVTERGLRRWYIGHVARIRASIGLDALRAATEKFAPLLREAQDQVVADWLEQIGN